MRFSNPVLPGLKKLAPLRGTIAQIDYDSQELGDIATISCELLHLDVNHSEQVICPATGVMQQDQPCRMQKSGTRGILRMRVSCFCSFFSNYNNKLSVLMGLPESSALAGWEALRILSRLSLPDLHPATVSHFAKWPASPLLHSRLGFFLRQS